MRKKIIISIVAIVILIAAVVAVITFRHQSEQNGGSTEPYATMEDASQNATFPMQYPDRLGGIPVTGFEANSSTIEARYGNDNYVRKTLGVTDNSGNRAEYSESSEQVIGDVTVTVKGNDGQVCLAVWNDNNFGFTVYVAGGVDQSEMIEYIEMTK